MLDNDAYLSPQEVANYLGVEYRTVLRMRERGVLPFIDLNPSGERRIYRIQVKELARTIKELQKKENAI